MHVVPAARGAVVVVANTNRQGDDVWNVRLRDGIYDRVVPAHSFKYAATLQELASRDTPVLIRIETKSGHGASSLTKALETTADIYAFMFHNMGITPKPIGS